jgi:hypothetical protein
VIRQALALLAMQRALTVRSWTRGKTLAAFLGLAMLLLGCAGAAGLSVALWHLAANLLEDRPAMLRLAAFDLLTLLFLFLSAWGLLMDMQRGDLLDLRRLLHLPLSPRLLFGVNYLYSLLSPALLFFAPGCVALATGLAAWAGPAAWQALPLGAPFFLMVSAWTYHARGWLAILLQDRRKRRLFAVLLPVVAILLSQVPAFASYWLEEQSFDWRRLLDDPVWTTRVVRVNQYFPPFWLPLGLHAALAGDVARVAWCGAGMASLGGLGLLLGYRTTLRYHRAGGNPGGTGSATRGTKGRAMTALPLPLLPRDTAALTLTFLLDFARHPAVRSQMIMPPLMTLLLCAGIVMRRGESLPEWSAGAAPLFVLLLPFLGSTMMFFNLFGTDIRGFRGLVLLPAARGRILLAKNLALFPFVSLQCVFVLGIAALATGAPPATLGLQLLHVPAAYLLFCVLGNLLSVLAPSPLSRDALRATGGRLMLMARGVAYAALAALALSPSMALLGMAARAQDTPPFVWWGTAALAAAALLLYRLTLTFTGDLLTAREQAILATLARDGA